MKCGRSIRQSHSIFAVVLGFAVFNSAAACVGASCTPVASDKPAQQILNGAFENSVSTTNPYSVRGARLDRDLVKSPIGADSPRVGQNTQAPSHTRPIGDSAYDQMRQFTQTKESGLRRDKVVGAEVKVNPDVSVYGQVKHSTSVVPELSIQENQSASVGAKFKW